MNTLSPVQTSHILKDPDRYTAIRACWHGLMNSDRKHELTAAHHLLYLALCGKDWRKGFTPPTNARKLANGAFDGWALFRALAKLHAKTAEEWLLTPFDGLVTPEMLEALRRLVPVRLPYQYSPGDFADGCYPFEAYMVEVNSENEAPEKESSSA